MRIIKSRFTVSAIAAALALALSTSAFAAGTTPQTTGTGGYSSVCNDITGLGCAPLAQSDAAQATGFTSVAVGWYSAASGVGAVSLGDFSVASGSTSTAVGTSASAAGTASTALGASANASGDQAMALGAVAQATAFESTAIGTAAQATGIGTTAVGDGAAAVGANTVALGTSSVANRADSVSVGDASTGFTRQITNMSGGTQATDAVNLAQLQSETAALGGGASYAGGIFTAPSYTFGSTTFSDVGSALSYLYNGSITGANVTNGDLILLTAGGGSINAGNVLGPQGPAGPQGPQGNTGATGATGAAGQNAPSGPGSDTSAVHYDTSASGAINYNSVTLQGGASGTQIHNLAAGAAPTDAANVSQVQQAQAQAINTSESYSTDYTNSQIAPLDNQISALGLAVSQLSNRLSGLGAAEQASAQMAMACSGDRNCISAGWGLQSGQGAVAIGFRHSVAGGKAAWTAGVSSSDAGTSVGVGFSINLH